MEQRQIITDKQGRNYDLFVSNGTGKVYTKLYDKQCCIGVVDGFYNSIDEFVLAQVEIFEKPVCADTFFKRLVRNVWGQNSPNYRRRGLGTALLEQFLFPYMRGNGIQRISGSITPLDGLTLAQLAAWYKRHGFTVSEARDGDVGELHIERVL